MSGRVIVTGGAGFIGAHLVRALASDGSAVLVIDDLSTGRADRLASDVRLEQVDIARDDLGGIVRAWRPSTIYHLAAQSSVPRSIAEPLHDLAVNVGGTGRIAAAARAAGTDRLVFVSSGGAIYGEATRPATEEAPPAPTSYYGIHKLAAEGHVRLSGISAAIVRPSNVYGAGQGAGLEGAVVASFIGAAVGAGTLRIDGDGRQTRDFLHVADLVAALQRLGGPDGPTGTWNVAAGRSISILELADIVEAALGRPIERIAGQARAGDVRHSSISAAALERLGWHAAIAVETGVTELVRAAVAPAPVAESAG